MGLSNSKNIRKKQLQKGLDIALDNRYEEIEQFISEQKDKKSFGYFLNQFIL